MRITIDGQNLFDEHELKITIGSITRDFLEKSASGLDGVLSIDLGKRSRTITQNGVLSAKSRVQMNDKINKISEYMDGNSHTLVSSSGEEYNNIRMDVFKITKERTSGSRFCCDYEIIYTQLKL